MLCFMAFSASFPIQITILLTTHLFHLIRYNVLIKRLGIIMKRLRLISKNMSSVLILDGSILQTIDAENGTVWCWPWISKNQLKNKLTGQCSDSSRLGIIYIQCHLDPSSFYLVNYGCWNCHTITATLQYTKEKYRVGFNR